MGMKWNAALPLPTELKEAYSLSEELKELKKRRDAQIKEIFTGEKD